MSENTYVYLLVSYQQICKLNNDDPTKIEELKILLTECEYYYNGLLPTPDPIRHLWWLTMWTYMAQHCSNKGSFHYLCYLAATYSATYFLENVSRFHRKEQIRKQHAQLESLMSGIKLRISAMLSE